MNGTQIEILEINAFLPGVWFIYLVLLIFIVVVVWVWVSFPLLVS